MQPDGGLRDQAERAARAGEQLAQVVAGHVLDDLAARLAVLPSARTIVMPISGSRPEP
jgi:hypothetical protein